MEDPEGRKPDQRPTAAYADSVQFVRDALAKLRFGAIQLTVHEGKLVQIDVTEKARFIT